MSAHIHADLMAEYAKDALVTDKPWERWELYEDSLQSWEPCASHPGWLADGEYRRKPVPLCQVEGRDVFPGDKLWWKARNEWVIVGGKFANSDSHLRVGSHDSAWPNDLSWTEPARTKTVYQWALEQPDGRFCATSYFYATEAEARVKGVAADHRKVLRLDWTALEVPA